MRDIKFRVWSNTRNGWVHNMLLLACVDGLPFAHFAEVNDGGDVIHHVYNASSLDVVIQQYTGIKDKNGVEIYEGDMIKYDNHDTPVLIRWTEEGHDHHPAWIFRDLFPQYGGFQAVGNIFENPELLQ